MISETKKNLITWFLLLCFTRPVICCVAKPDRGSTRRPPRTAFYLYQKVPDIDEYSQGASGKPTKVIRYGSPAYKQLPINYNPGIVFEHMPERSGDTRKMTKVCVCAVFHLFTIDDLVPYEKYKIFPPYIHLIILLRSFCIFERFYGVVFF